MILKDPEDRKAEERCRYKHSVDVWAGMEGSFKPVFGDICPSHRTEYYLTPIGDRMMGTPLAA